MMRQVSALYFELSNKIRVQSIWKKVLYFSVYFSSDFLIMFVSPIFKMVSDCFSRIVSHIVTDKQVVFSTHL